MPRTQSYAELIGLGRGQDQTRPVGISLTRTGTFQAQTKKKKRNISGFFFLIFFSQRGTLLMISVVKGAAERGRYVA